MKGLKESMYLLNGMTHLNGTDLKKYPQRLGFPFIVVWVHRILTDIEVQKYGNRQQSVSYVRTKEGQVVTFK